MISIQKACYRCCCFLALLALMLLFMLLLLLLKFTMVIDDVPNVVIALDNVVVPCSDVNGVLYVVIDVL